MDWIEDFVDKFSNESALKNLWADKFHGSITINFSDGVPHSCKINKNLRAKQSTLKEGD